MTASHRDEGDNAKAFIFSAIVFACFEAAGLYFTDLAGGVDGYLSMFFHFISLCCYAAGPFGAWHEMISGENAAQKKKRIWLWYLIPCVLNFPIAYFVWNPPQPTSKPHFTVSFATEDVPAILLTNECLFQESLERTGTNASKDTVFFRNLAHGCIIIPVDPSKTNVVFDFGIQNDSALTIYDLSMAVGFPNEWEIEVDTSRWKKAREHLIIPGWELWYTNLQSWAADNHSPMFPSDSIEFSITNFTVPIYKNPTSKNGIISFVVRSTGFEEIILANLIFFPKNSSFMKPIVAKMEKGTNGLWHISVTPKEMEDSQK